MSKLEQNTTSLDEVLAMVNALPNAGGGGASVETCTIVITNDITSKGAGLQCWGFTVFENGEIKNTVYTWNDGDTIVQSKYVFENVVCGSVCYINFYNTYSFGYLTTNNVEELIGGGYGYTLVFVAPSEAGSTGTLWLFDDD